MGAGVQVFEVVKATQAQGLVAVTGDCPTVGVAGVYTQEGGHGPLALTFGLAADQLLESEVVTETGQLLTASPAHNADFYWALSSGGGGNYGVVLSLISKVYVDQHTAAANLTRTNEGVSMDTLYNTVQTFINNTPILVDAAPTPTPKTKPCRLESGQLEEPVTAQLP